MKAIKLLNIVLAGVVASVVLTGGVAAKEICFTQYGGGETCIEEDEDAKIDVDKKVSDKDGDYENHLKSSVHKFSAGDKVYFKIKVENKGDVDLRHVELKDELPDFVEFYEEIDGDADVNGSTVKFDLGSLDKGESKTVRFIAKVVDEDDLPVDDKVCLTNIAKAEGDRKDNDDEEKDSDYANFCIDLPDVLGDETPTQLPKAGAGMSLALAGIASITSGTLYRKRIAK
jgi:uncharacterized repeat protein (TIGR01451 family)